MKDVRVIINELKCMIKMSKNKKNEILSLLEKASESYYNTSEDIMSDEDFDDLKREFERLGGVIAVGAEPPKGKGIVEVEHSFNDLVGTLEKANFIYIKDVDDPSKTSVEEWIRKVVTKVKHHLTLGISFKFDGNSVVGEYNNGKPIKFLTRGSNGLGMDLTHVFKDHRISNKDHVGIKYEIIIPWDKYEQLMEDTGLSYANPRSLVSGKLGDDNAYQFYKYMELVPLWVRKLNDKMERTDELDFIEECFGEDNLLFKDYRLIEDVDGSKEGLKLFLDELEEMYTFYTTERYNLPFMIDGLVVEILDKDARELLGYTNEKKDIPNWAIALKFPYMEKSTKVSGFDFTLGDSGVITSRVWFEPVEFNGTIHSKQSLQNYKRFKELGFGIGSDILVQYRNDCLTYVLPLETENNKKIKPYEYAKACPICGGEVKITDTGAFAYCANDVCEGKIVGRVQNFLTKMDIKGIKEATIIKLRDAGLVKNIVDLYNLDFDKVSKIEGLGSTTAFNILGAVNSKIPYDYEILGALGIDSFSTSKAKDLCKEHTLQELLEKAIEEPSKLRSNIQGVEGFSEITADYIADGLAENKETIEFLLSRDHKIYKEDAKKFSNTKILKIVFTEFRNEALQTALEMQGHKVTGSVSSKTDVVVTPNPNGSTAKLKKARELGIRIVTVDEFKAEMGLA